jgi:hypothetical protein
MFLLIPWRVDVPQDRWPVMNWLGWITMEKYEKSLLQMWEERRRGREREPLEMAYARLGLHMTEEERRQEASAPAPSAPKEAQDQCIRLVCTCGKRMKAPARYAGRSAKCPRCGTRLKIPTLTP